MAATITKIAIECVTKVFGAVRALAEARLEISPGEIVAVMGPNGAGKSTLLAILSLTMRPTRGEVRVNDETVSSSATELRARIGLLSHHPLVYPDLTARENLLLFARLYDLADPVAATARVEDDLGLAGFAADRPTRVLSRGQLQRVSLARALVTQPDLLLLDEPAAGLDTEAVGRIDQLLRGITERGGMAVLVTHEPTVASRVATRAVMLRQGAIVKDISAPEDSSRWRNLYDSTVRGEKP